MSRPSLQEKGELEMEPEEQTTETNNKPAGSE